MEKRHFGFLCAICLMSHTSTLLCKKKSGSESTCEKVCAYHEVTLQGAKEGHTCVLELVLLSEHTLHMLYRKHTDTYCGREH